MGRAGGWGGVNNSRALHHYLKSILFLIKDLSLRITVFWELLSVL